MRSKKVYQSIFILFIILILSVGIINLVIANKSTKNELEHANKNLSIMSQELNDANSKYENIQNQLKENQQLLDSTRKELDITLEDLKVEYEKYIKLSKEFDITTDNLIAIKNELDAANVTINDLKSAEYELLYIGEFKLTHYCNEPYEHICGFGDGLTATGTQVKPGYTIAVDPKVIPYGTEVYIEGYGWRVAEDCGGAVKGNHIDVAVNLHSEAMKLGVKHGGVWILVKKSS